jgi:hypothetical protein
MGSQELPICFSADTKSPSSANFVGIVVGFLNVLLIRLRSLLLAQLKQDSSTNELQFTE